MSSTKCFSGLSVYKNGCPGRSVKMVAHCTQVHDMWPFGLLVFSIVSYCTRGRKIAGSNPAAGFPTTIGQMGKKAKLGLFIINLMLCANLNKVQRIRTYKGRINSNVSERQAKKICFKRYFKFVI